jgi:single-stranded DNA-binding protein
MYMNRVTLCGFVTADAKHLAIHGKEITGFSLATAKHRDHWHDCVVYGNSVKFPDNALQKGSHLLIEGELAYRQYDRRIETDSGPINVKWPIAEIVVHSIAALNRHTKEGAAA